MNKDRILWVVAVPFLICFVAPSIIGGLLIKYQSMDYLDVATVVGGFIVFGMPAIMIIGYKKTKPSKPIMP